jgi:hypothetical protein
VTEVTLEVDRADAGELAAALEAAGAGSVVVQTKREAERDGAESVRLGLDRRMRSVAPEALLVTVSILAGTGIRAAASVLVEHIRSKQKVLKVQRADGTVLEIQGEVDVEEVERLLAAGGPEQLPPAA